tara:strand:+ start:1205 stop:1759 length:555 start_codon:yes stop_codon:yes gene_type:complete
MKSMWKGTMVAWHEGVAAQHFDAAAYSEYSEVYSGYRSALPGKRRGGRPLFQTGHLRKQILAKRQRSNITSTSKGARMKLKYGRPRGMTPAKLEKIARNIYFKARREGASSVVVKGRRVQVDLKRITSAMFRNAGYSADAKRTFQKLIGYVSRKEERQIAREAKSALIKFANAPDLRKTVKVSL